MKCQVCGSENETGKFCTKCGSPLQSEQVAGSASSANQNQQPPYAGVNQNQGNPNQQQFQGYGSQPNQFQGNPNQQPYGGGYQQYPNQQQPNEYLEKGKVVSKQYFGFFLNSLKNPIQFGNTVNANHWINGLITVILSVIILSLGIASYFNRIYDVSGMSYFVGDMFDLSFGSVFLKGLLYLGIYTALIIVIAFGAIKLLNGAHVSFQHVLARLGSFFTVPAIISLFFILVTFMDSPNILLFFISLISLSINLAVILTIISFRTNAKLDVFYSILIALAVLIIVQVIGVNMILDNIVEQIQSGFDYFGF